MKANELRIGNWIIQNNLSNIEVEGVAEFGINPCLEYGDFVTEYGYGVLSGIPITPEILVKMGAVNKYGCVYFIRKLKFTYEINELSQFVRFHYSGKVAYLQYVHQLQNLYFALTGTELEFTL